MLPRRVSLRSLQIQAESEGEKKIAEILKQNFSASQIAVKDISGWYTRRFHKQTAKRRKIGHYFLPGGGRKGVGRIWADPPSISPRSYVIPKILSLPCHQKTTGH